VDRASLYEQAKQPFRARLQYMVSDNQSQERIAPPEVFSEAEMVPLLICSRPMFVGGANDARAATPLRY
jgi:hypothetical protein